MPRRDAPRKRGISAPYLCPNDASSLALEGAAGCPICPHTRPPQLPTPTAAAGTPTPTPARCEAPRVTCRAITAQAFSSLAPFLRQVRGVHWRLKSFHFNAALHSSQTLGRFHARLERRLTFVPTPRRSPVLSTAFHPLHQARPATDLGPSLSTRHLAVAPDEKLSVDALESPPLLCADAASRCPQ